MNAFSSDFGSENLLNLDTRSTIDRGADGCSMRPAPGLTLIHSCLPALTVLEQNGVTYLTLLIQLEDGVACDYYIKEPRFLGDIRVPRKNLEEVRDAFSAVCLAVKQAIEVSIEGTDEEESSFFAYVSLSCCDRPGGWSIDCAITAMIDVTSPGDVIELP